MVGDSLRERMGLQPNTAEFDRKVNGWKRYRWRIKDFTPEVRSRLPGGWAPYANGLFYLFEVNEASGRARLSALSNGPNNSHFPVSVRGQCR